MLGDYEGLGEKGKDGVEKSENFRRGEKPRIFCILHIKCRSGSCFRLTPTRYPIEWTSLRIKK